MTIKALFSTTRPTLLFLNNTKLNKTMNGRLKSNVRQININTRLNDHYNMRNKISHFIAFQYDILMVPAFASGSNQGVGTESSSRELLNSFGFDVKFNLDIKLYCNYSTDTIRLVTREFTNIVLGMEKIDVTDMSIKTWSYDSTTNILEIKTSAKCLPTLKYKLKVTIFYKNYASYSYDKSSKPGTS